MLSFQITQSIPSLLWFLASAHYGWCLVANIHNHWPDYCLLHFGFLLSVCFLFFCGSNLEATLNSIHVAFEDAKVTERLPKQIGSIFSTSTSFVQLQ